MKNFIYKTLDKIAVSFLRREFEKEHSAKLFSILYQDIIKRCIENQTDNCKISWVQEYNNKLYNISSDVIVEETKNEEK